MTWSVVIFTNEDKVEAVPKNWCITTSSECFWPDNSVKTEKIFKLIENKADPDTNWKVHPVKLLGTYDDFKIAQRKARKAMTSSDISSMNEEAILNKKRKRKENPKFQYSGSESSSDSDDNIYPRKSVLKSLFIQGKNTVKSKTIKRFRSKSFSPKRSSERHATDKILDRSFLMEREDFDSDNQQPDSDSQQPNISNQSFLNPLEASCLKVDLAGTSPQTSLARKSIGDHAVGTVEGKRAILEKSSSGVSSDNDFKKLVTGELTLLNLKVNAISENVSTILSLMRQKENTATEPVLLKNIQIFNNKLPLKSNEELKEFEDWLKEENNYKFMVTEFRRLGGQSLPQAVRKILYKLLTNEVALLYSWDGAKKKAPLKILLLARCILDAIKIQYPEALNTDVTSVIKIWLVKAKERLTKKPQEPNSQQLQEPNLIEDIN